MDLRPRFFVLTSTLLWGVGLCVLAFLSVYLILNPHFLDARYMHTIRDTLSTSAPNAPSNHTVEFTLLTALPPQGYIQLTPEAGAFLVPTSSEFFDIDNTELAVANGTSAPYVVRSATTTPDATHDGVVIVRGTSGSIRFDLNTSLGINAGSRVRIRLGSHTQRASSTVDTGIVNPSVVKSYSLAIEAGGGEVATGKAMIAIIDQVRVLPINTREFVPPVRFNGAPTGTLSHTVSAAELSVETDEFATCRYTTAPNTPYFSISSAFSSTGRVIHTVLLTDLTPSSTHSYYVRCIDDEGNINTDDYPILFSIRPVPDGVPGTGTSTDGGGGSGSTGSGSGSSGSGSGSSGGNTSGSGSGGSGGGGGSKSGNDGDEDGGGGFEPSPNPYPSGDAQITISGFAFPGSTVTILVDGKIAKTTRASGSGSFSVTLDAILRGTYTFGVYATDQSNTRSSTFSTSFSVAGGRASTLSNVNIMPTVKVSPNPVQPGQKLSVSGFAIPNSTVEVENQRQKPGPEKKVFTAVADSAGRWSLEIDTTGFQNDTWKVRTRSIQKTLGITTQYSGFTLYGVGQAATKTLNADLNRDGKVNLIDFSILLFHWNTDGGRSDPPADINQDGKVTLTDFSIMIFNWTG
jgi:hypothetical protein